MKVVYLADAPYVHTRRWVEHFVARGVEAHVISFRPADIPGAAVHYIDGFEAARKAAMSGSITFMPLLRTSSICAFSSAASTWFW